MSLSLLFYFFYLLPTLKILFTYLFWIVFTYLF